MTGNTTNPSWPELTTNKLRGKMANPRPNEVVKRYIYNIHLFPAFVNRYRENCSGFILFPDGHSS